MASDRTTDPIDRRAALCRSALSAIGLVAGSTLLGGCASGKQNTADLPEPVWPAQRRQTFTSTPTVASPAPATPTPSNSVPGGVIRRAQWAKGSPVPALMERAQPYYRITLHHDGMNAFTSVARGDAAERLENIRRAHRSKNWGDVGYHYLIDPAGRVWEGRPLMYQGAHVGHQNEGNLGICLMGNYERQYPNAAQLETIERFVGEMMSQYRVDVRNVRTHREMAPTACPGRNLQPRLVAMRRSGGALA